MVGIGFRREGTTTRSDRAFAGAGRRYLPPGGLVSR
jgi:hypothetical protein